MNLRFPTSLYWFEFWITTKIWIFFSGLEPKPSYTRIYIYWILKMLDYKLNFLTSWPSHTHPSCLYLRNTLSHSSQLCYLSKLHHEKTEKAFTKEIRGINFRYSKKKRKAKQYALIIGRLRHAKSFIFLRLPLRDG